MTKLVVCFRKRLCDTDWIGVKLKGELPFRGSELGFRPVPKVLNCIWVSLLELGLRLKSRSTSIGSNSRGLDPGGLGDEFSINPF